MSRSAIPSRPAARARAREDSGAILKRGAAMSVFPQRRSFDLSASHRIGRSERSDNVAPSRSAKFNSGRDSSRSVLTGSYSSPSALYIMARNAGLGASPSNRMQRFPARFDSSSDRTKVR